MPSQNKLKAARAGIAAFMRDRSRSRAGNAYGTWFYNNDLWKQTTWLGVPIQKLPFDLWNYQEILTELQPSLVVEFGSCFGGSALYFSHLLCALGKPYHVLSVDVDHSRIFERSRQDANIEFLTCSSTEQRVAEAITEWRRQLPGPVFAILDSDHTKKHVLGEMELLRPVRHQRRLSHC